MHGSSIARIPIASWWAVTVLVCVPASVGAAGQPATDASARHSHVVVPGDTLIGLLRPGADWRAVQRNNRGVDPRRLQPGSTLSIPLALLRERPATAQVLHARGDATIVRAGTTAALPAQVGSTVADGDVLATGEQSSITLLLVDGSKLLLRPESRLRVESLATLGSSAVGSTRLQLEYGSTDSLVTPAAAPVPHRYQLRTPVANLGVRGTEFRTRADSETTRVEVLAGSVFASASARLAPRPLSAGFGAVITAQATATPQALMPAPDLAQLPERVERLPLRLAWTAAPAAAGYRAQIFLAAAGPATAPVLDGHFASAEAGWADDLPDGPYELHVRTAAASGLEGPDARAAFTLKARPEPPFTIRPANGQRSIDDAPSFAWSRSAAAARYRLQVADGADFKVLRIDLRDIVGTEQRVELPLGSHFWRVASVRADGDQGPFGDAQTVVRIAPPLAPVQQAPQPRADGLLLSWRAAVAGEKGTRYRVQVAFDDTFTRIEHDELVGEAEWLLRSAAAGTRYLRVKTITADGLTGPFGDVQQVELPPPPPPPWLLLLPLLMLLL